ncbi:hypothetical protein ALC62_01522 [Cyphomyrmex costatus]|uniref:Uncharacterized protein n=1 Tax=Cyphomyrmex costatus TaxID=456900 RepID=A0A195D332_9HYME|nr:hypothetical protein ALC62_01522 [Cyphomyrmex costatus]
MKPNWVSRSGFAPNEPGPASNSRYSDDLLSALLPINAGLIDDQANTDSSVTNQAPSQQEKQRQRKNEYQEESIARVSEERVSHVGGDMTQTLMTLR